MNLRIRFATMFNRVLTFRGDRAGVADIYEAAQSFGYAVSELCRAN
jgi:hypothetical protein